MGLSNPWIYPPTTVLANVQNLNPSLVFNKYRKALANTRNGTSDTRVILYGDSTFAGQGSSTGATIPATKSVATQLAALLNSTATPACVSLGVPVTQLGSGTDNRWTLGSGWAVSGLGFGAASGAAYKSTATTAGALVYTPSPQVTCDGFYVYWLGNGGLGTIRCTATGGTPTDINCSVAGGTYRTLVSAGSASSSNTISITQPVTNANVFVVGIEPVLSTKKQVLVGNAGVGSALTGNWSSSGSFGGMAFIGVTAPDLGIVSLGINDAFAANTDASVTYNIGQVISAIKATGDCIVCSTLPSGDTSANAFERRYSSIFQSLAASNNCAFLDIFNRWGGTYNSNFMNADQVHGNDAGYWDWAQFIANVIGNP